VPPAVCARCWLPLRGRTSLEGKQSHLHACRSRGRSLFVLLGICGACCKQYGGRSYSQVLRRQKAGMHIRQSLLLLQALTAERFSDAPQRL
jgi:hypothetical protein